MLKNQLLQIRLSMGFKFQKEFAHFLEVEQYQYNRYERNERQPTLEIAFKICNKLNRDIRQIFYIES